jgi:ABC-type transport system involved in multi-copper enzyme maturation permease subunit
MLARTFAIAMNAYREAVRARVLYGLFALAIGTAAYSLVVASLSLHQEARVVADIGASSISLYAVLVAIVLGSTSLYRELELKTVFPILSRPLRRHEYLLGKYFGMLATLAVFVAIDAAAVMIVLALQTGQTPWKVAVTVLLLGGILAVTLVRAKYTRVFVLIPWSAALALCAFVLASTAGDERRLVVASSVLTLCEVSIVTAVATLFASFSSPFLTAVLTVFVFIIGRSADTMANLPPKLFGEWLAAKGRFWSHVFPNLHVYVPARPLLLGQVPDVSLVQYIGVAAAHAAFYSAVLLVVGALVFRKRDFQ